MRRRANFIAGDAGLLCPDNPVFLQQIRDLPLSIFRTSRKLSLASHNHFQFLPAKPCPSQSQKQSPHSVITVSGPHTVGPPFFDVLCAQSFIHFWDRQFCSIDSSRGFWLRDAILNPILRLNRDSVVRLVVLEECARRVLWLAGEDAASL